METPSSAAAPIPDSFPAQRIRLREKLGRLPEALTGDLKVLHAFLSRDHLLAKPYVAKRSQLTTLEATWETLAKAGYDDGDTMAAVFLQIEQLIVALEGKDGDTAKKKLAIVMDLPLVKAAVAHEKAYAEIMSANVSAALTYAGLKDQAQAPAVEFLFGVGSPMKPPAGSGDALEKEYAGLMDDAKALRTLTAPALRATPPDPDATLGEKLAVFGKRLAKYEVDCRAAGRSIFLKEMGFPADCTEEELSQFITSLARPIAPPSEARDPKNRTKAVVLEQYKKLNERRLEVSNKVALAMRRNLAGEIGKKQVEAIAEFLANRSLYERKVLQKPEVDTDQMLLYMGITLNEVAEELMEGFCTWETLNQKGLQKIPILRDLPAATRLAVVKGWEQVCAQLGKAGLPMQSLGKVFGTLTRMPLGGKFWADLLSVESPVTVLLWGLYLHESPNKIKATMQFASFIMIGNATSKVATAALTELRALGLIKFCPKNPYALFAIGMTVAFLSADKLDKICTWADKNIPESASKDFVANVFSTISGDFAFGGLEELAEITGVSTVDPDRDFRTYMTRPANLASPGAMMNGDYFHTIDDWNIRVDQAMKSGEGRESKIALNLWELRKIKDVKEWAKGQSVALHIQTASLISQERQLESTLGYTLGGVELATRSGKGFRNDKEVRYAFGGTGKDATGLKKARDHFDAMATKAGGAAKVTDASFKLFQQYSEMLQDVAKDVSLLNYLDVYDRETWLGDLSQFTKEYVPPTEYVRAGLVQQIAEAMRRNRTVSASTYPDMKAEDFATELAKAVKTEEKISILGGLGEDFSTLYKEWKGPGIDIFKGAQSLNIPTIGIRDELFQLMMQINFATKELHESLSKDVANTLLADVFADLQQLASSREIVTSEKLRAIRAKLTQALLKAKVGKEKVWAVEDKGRFDLRGVPIFIQGDLPGPVWISNGDITVDYVRSFVRQEARSESDNLILLQSRSTTGDLQVFCFQCVGSNRRNWEVRTVSAQRQLYYRGRQTVNSVTYTGRRTLSYDDFCKEYPGSAAGLEEQFKSIEAVALRKEEERKTLETRRNEEIAVIKAEYIRANEADRMKDLSKVILYRNVSTLDRYGKVVTAQVPMGNIKELLDDVEKTKPLLQKRLEATKIDARTATYLQERLSREITSLSRDSATVRQCYDAGVDVGQFCHELLQKFDDYQTMVDFVNKQGKGDYWDVRKLPLLRPYFTMLSKLSAEEREAVRIVLMQSNLKAFETMLNDKGPKALRDGLDKDATAYAEKVANWRLAVRSAAQNKTSLNTVGVSPEGKGAVTIGRFEDWIILARNNSYDPKSDSTEINSLSSKIHDPDGGRGHHLRYYRIKAKDVEDPTKLNLADLEKNPGIEWINMSSDMLYSDLGDDWKRLAKHVLLRDQSGGTSAHLWRVLNLFPYQIAWSDRSNAKHKLHSALLGLSHFVRDDDMFYDKLLSKLIELKTGGEKGITWSGVSQIKDSLYDAFYRQWGLHGSVRGEPESVRQVIVRVFR